MLFYMMRITQKQIKTFMKDKLSTSPKWAVKGMLKIYEYQTQDEQNTGDTVEDNGVGFSGADGMILSSLCEQYQKRNSLSPKQMALVYKKMPKYWRQLASISDEKKLHSMIAEEAA